MDKKLEDLIPALEELLSKEDYSGFYIGKTDDCNSRKCDHHNEGLALFWEFAKGKSEAINQGEIDLINYFKQESPLKDKCLNENKGGAGNTEATHLYVAAKFNNEILLTIDDLHDDVINPFEPLIKL